MKRGFTLIEIILSITLIVIIGAGSIVGFSIYKKYDKEKQLNNMDSEILTALRMYIETSDEAKERIYKDKEGMAITLETLQNEGLIDFGNIAISGQDDYVVAFLTEDKDCSDISTLNGWNFQDGKPLYICTNSDGSKNVFYSGVDSYNESVLSRDADHTVKGKYVSFNDNIFRLLYLDSDDSLVLYTQEDDSGVAFGNVFDGLTQKIRGYGSKLDGLNLICNNGSLKGTSYEGNSLDNYFYLDEHYYYWYGDVLSSNEVYVSPDDIFRHSTCKTDDSVATFYPAFFGDELSETRVHRHIYPGYNELYINYSSYNGYKKIKLKSCVKIVSGVGDDAQPYILKNKC